jgi:hypothetical protein
LIYLQKRHEIEIFENFEIENFKKRKVKMKYLNKKVEKRDICQILKSDAKVTKRKSLKKS